jgi:hypothetical protein
MSVRRCEAVSRGKGPGDLLSARVLTYKPCYVHHTRTARWATVQPGCSRIRYQYVLAGSLLLSHPHSEQPALSEAEGTERSITTERSRGISMPRPLSPLQAEIPRLPSTLRRSSGQAALRTGCSIQPSWSPRRRPAGPMQRVDRLRHRESRVKDVQALVPVQAEFDGDSPPHLDTVQCRGLSTGGKKPLKS